MLKSVISNFKLPSIRNKKKKKKLLYVVIPDSQIDVIKVETMESLLLILWLKSCSDTDE